MADIYFKMVHPKDNEYIKLVKYDKKIHNIDMMSQSHKLVDKNGNPFVAKPEPVKAAPVKPAKKKTAKK